MIESQISQFATIGYDLRDHTDSKANKGYKALRMQKKIPLALKNRVKLQLRMLMLRFTWQISAQYMEKTSYSRMVLHICMEGDDLSTLLNLLLQLNVEYRMR